MATEKGRLDDLLKSASSAAEFYASAKHQEVPKWLGLSGTPRELPNRKWNLNDSFSRFEDLLLSFPPAKERTPEWKARAEARKQQAQAELDRLYASKTASTSEIRHAEREWEFADDELDFGPFLDSDV